MIISAQGVGESFWDRGLLSLLIHGDNHEFGCLGPAHIDKIAPLQVADQDRPPDAGLVAPGAIRARDSCGDLELGIEGSPHPLSIALRGMIGHGYEHFGAQRI